MSAPEPLEFDVKVPIIHQPQPRKPFSPEILPPELSASPYMELDQILNTPATSPDDPDTPVDPSLSPLLRA